ncbi:MAG: hypothetical protein FJ104_03540 [Deltaproteobacteria bacterium]|nr:hypothetical protein [Deltaproteobacteria bacterium]
MLKLRRLGLPLLVAASLGFACSTGPGPRVPAGGPGLGAPRVPFRDKTREERAAFMAAHVVPEMKRVFAKHGPVDDFDCTTCHGADAEAVDYEMPNSLYALPEADPVAEAESVDPEVAKFMVESVVPGLAAVLGVPAGKPGGVTCFTCHPKE